MAIASNIGDAAERVPCVPNVRFGSLADMLTSPRHVGFTLNNGRWTEHPSQHFGYAFMSTRPNKPLAHGGYSPTAT